MSDNILKTFKEGSNVFENFRKTQKEVGNMFLFGDMTDKIMLLIYKIYHENIIRLLLNQDISNPNNSEFMMGILQLNDDSIYVTISEEPDEDTKYGEKMQTLYSILKQTNVDVTMPEPDMREKPRTVSGWRIPLSAGNDKYESKVII